MLASPLYRIMKTVSKFMCFTLYLPFSSLSSKGVPHRGIIFGHKKNSPHEKAIFPLDQKIKKKPDATLFYRSVQHQAMLE